MVAAGRALRLGYFDHPPLSWWLSAGAAHLAGSEAALVVRLPFIALFSVSTWLMYRLTARLFSPAAGVCAAAALNLAPVFGVTAGTWVLPDGPLVCALLAAALCLVHALEGRGWTWWLGAGAGAGCALLSKYSAVLTLVGVFLYLLTQPRHRQWLARPHPYVAALLAFFLFTPVLAWNAAHGWASFAFQGERAVAYRFNALGPVATLAGEALYLLPWIWFPLVVEFVRGLRGGPADWRAWLLCWLAVGPVVLFAVVALWSRGVQFHWAAPGYLFLFPLLGAQLVRWQPTFARVWLRGSAALVCAGILLVTAEVNWNWIGLIRRGADSGLQAVDWTPLRSALQSRGLLDGAIVAAPNWRDAGKVDYALGGNPPVLCLNTDAREFGFSPGPAAHVGQDVLIVAPRQTPAQIGASYGAVFESIEPLAAASVPLRGRGVVEFPLYLGHRLLRWP
jgi:4-amino-4-deoxy-L-arabinose transferase-like glycosyltransferase